MEIYSPRKRRQVVKSKNCYKSNEIEIEETRELESENSEMFDLMKERMKNRFYNMMQYFFVVEEVK